MKYIFLFFLLFVTVLVIFRKKLLHYMIEQCKHPHHFIGIIMARIWNHKFKRMTDWGLEEVHFPKNARILDVGCGGGETVARLSKALRDESASIHGVDISKTAIQIAKKRNKQATREGNVSFSVASVEKLPYESHRFDLIFTCQSYMYWEDVEKGFLEIARVMKKRGQLIIVTEKYIRDYHMKRYKTDQEFTKLLLNCGFLEVHSMDAGKWVKYLVRK